MAETAAKWKWRYHGNDWRRCEGAYTDQTWYYAPAPQAAWPKFPEGVRYKAQFACRNYKQRQVLVDDSGMFLDGNIGFYCVGSMMREIARLDKILSAYKWL
jgi:hypothetical protein